MSIIDFDRVIMINLDLAMEAMYYQIITPFLHFTTCYIATIHFGLGIIGTGLLEASSPNLFICVLKMQITHNLAIKDQRSPRMTYVTRELFKNINEFLKLAIPSILLALTECSAYYFSIIIISGLISLTN